jgi:hypothetical protein
MARETFLVTYFSTSGFDPIDQIISRMEFFCCFVFLVGVGFELRASCLQSGCSTTCATPPVHFALVILEMESLELFAQADLELESSQSQPLKQLG